MGPIGTRADEQLSSIASQTQTVSESTRLSEWSQESIRLPEKWAAASTEPDSSCTLIHEGVTENKIYAPSLSCADSRSVFFGTPKRLVRHKRPVSTLLPIGFLVGCGGIWDRMRVRCRLWRISWRIHRGAEIPSGFYRDLVEIQRCVLNRGEDISLTDIVQNRQRYIHGLRTMQSVVTSQQARCCRSFSAAGRSLDEVSAPRHYCIPPQPGGTPPI